MLVSAPAIVLLSGPLYYSSLPLWTTLIPMLVGIGIYLLKDQWETLRKGCALAASIFAFIGVMLLYPYSLAGSVSYDLIDFMQLGLFF